MANKRRRWQTPTGLASLVLGLLVTVVILLLAVGITTYQQIIATRQVVSATVTTALRTAAPAAFAGQTPSTATSTVADNLAVNAAAYVQAVDTALPTFWAGSSVAPCTTTPAGSPVACTAQTSFLLTLPASTATALHISGPIVLSDIQLADTPPYTVTHLGQTSTLSEPAVAAEVAVPLHLVIGSLLTMNPWVTVGVTQVLYADQGGPTGGAARFLPYGTATPPPNPNDEFCWSWPDSSNPACATMPDYCQGDDTSCFLSPGGISAFSSTPSGAQVADYYGGKETYSSLGTALLDSPDPPSLPWIMPASGLCWVQSSSNSDEYTLTGTAGSPNCATLPSGDCPPAWATEIVYTPGSSSFLFDTPASVCYVGTLPGSPSGSGTSTAVWVCLDPSDQACEQSSGGGFSCRNDTYMCGADTCCPDPIPI